MTTTDDLDTFAPAGGLLDHLNATATPEPEPAPPAHRRPGTLVEFFLAGSTEVLTARILNRDRIAYERAAMRHKEWPTGQSFVITFLVWSVLRRESRTSATFDQFCDQLDDYDLVEDVPADPTR